MKLEIEVKKLAEEAKPFTKAGPDEAGWDIYCIADDYFDRQYLFDPIKGEMIESFFELQPGETKKFHTGIAAAIPVGWYAQIQSRSGMAAKAVTHLGGVIDSTYRGEWIVILSNLNPDKQIVIGHGDKIAQFVLLPVPNVSIKVVEELEETYRGLKGFGDLTGR